MSRPTTMPEFAIEDDANIGEPISALKEDGWADEEIPTAKNWNWFAHWVSKWLAWFDVGKMDTVTILTGTLPVTGLTEVFINLPSGFTKENAMIVSAKMKHPSYTDWYVLPWLFSNIYIDGFIVGAVSPPDPDRIDIKSDIILDGFSYVIYLHKSV